jgi:glycosyltransferase involved in cell wall biosynthesis
MIPCHNYGRFLAGAVSSALSQPEVQVDVVIVDDASTDDSVEVAESFVTSDPRVQLVRHSSNHGHVETFNEGLSLATGEFVVKLDADDLLAPGSLARSTALMQSYPNVAFCYGRAHVFRGDPPSDFATETHSWSVWPGHRWLRRVLRRGHNVIHQPEILIRRSAVEATGGYRPQLRWAEDYNWFLRLSAIGDVGRVNGPVQGLYREHEASILRSADDLELRDLEARIAAVELFFAESSDRLADVEALRRIALTSLARNARQLAASSLERPAGGREASAQFSAIAVGLYAQAGIAPRRSPSFRTDTVGRTLRDLEWRLRSRRWHHYGV